MPSSWEKSGIELHQVAWAVAGVCSFASCIISVWMIYKHLKHYNEPKVSYSSRGADTTDTRIYISNFITGSAPFRLGKHFVWLSKIIIMNDEVIIT